ncbi:MAG: sulfatase-like hydrolase/transferase [Vicinamibacterales bacterium]
MTWLSLAAAILVLNVSVAFENIWPTPAVTWRGALSVELGACLAVLLLATRIGRPASRRLLAMLSAVWVLLIVGRYVDVTTPALLGRPVNLFWDVRYAWDVAAMFLKAAPLWAVCLGALGALIAARLLFGVVRWAMARTARGAATPRERTALAAVAFALVAGFASGALDRGTGPDRVSPFATPVTEVLDRQVRLVRTALTRSRSLPPSPPMTSDLSHVAGADVLLVFMESYGAVTWQRDDFVRRLQEPREQLAAAIRNTGRRVVSGYVESPTYGGSSWFAHISLLSGVEVTDPDTNVLLMAQRRETLVTAFARRGYRTVALMPGMWAPWPEGAFYGFQEMYGGERLAYKGPEFGWWALPDQYALAKFDQLELTPGSRPRVFAFFPTVSTHTPFTPTPPYEPDWTRILSDHPFDDAVITRLYDEQPDWMNLSPSYGNAVAYAHEVLAGYLRLRGDRDVVLIVLGDHQPPALVSGEHQPWDVPVHVISSRPELADRLLARGFREGLDPSGPRLGKMHSLLPTLLEAFGGPPDGAATAARAAAPR